MATLRRNLKWRLRNLMSCFLPLCIARLGEEEGSGSRGECRPTLTAREPDTGTMEEKKKGGQRRCDRGSKGRSSRVSDVCDPIGGECKAVAEDYSNWSRYLEEDYIVFCFDISSDRDTKALTITRTPSGISHLIGEKEEKIDIDDPICDQFDESNRSFAFPVLRWEPIGSPDYMPKPEDPDSRKPSIRSRSARVHCCNF